MGKKKLMKEIAGLARWSFLEKENFEKIVDSFNGVINEDQTSHGFKIWFEKDGEEFSCALKDFRGSIFYFVYVGNVDNYKGPCINSDKRARELYRETMNRLSSGLFDFL